MELANPRSSSKVGVRTGPVDGKKKRPHNLGGGGVGGFPAVGGQTGHLFLKALVGAIDYGSPLFTSVPCLESDVEAASTAPARSCNMLRLCTPCPQVW